jgi:hypothetical protein
VAGSRERGDEPSGYGIMELVFQVVVAPDYT